MNKQQSNTDQKEKFITWLVKKRICILSTIYQLSTNHDWIIRTFIIWKSTDFTSILLIHFSSTFDRSIWDITTITIWYYHSFYRWQPLSYWIHSQSTQSGNWQASDATWQSTESEYHIFSTLMYTKCFSIWMQFSSPSALGLLHIFLSTISTCNKHSLISCLFEDLFKHQKPSENHDN